MCDEPPCPASEFAKAQDAPRRPDQRKSLDEVGRSKAGERTAPELGGITEGAD